jgi:hypothetical protein
VPACDAGDRGLQGVRREWPVGGRPARSRAPSPLRIRDRSQRDRSGPAAAPSNHSHRVGPGTSTPATPRPDRHRGPAERACRQARSSLSARRLRWCDGCRAPGPPDSAGRGGLFCPVPGRISSASRASWAARSSVYSARSPPR